MLWLSDIYRIFFMPGLYAVPVPRSDQVAVWIKYGEICGIVLLYSIDITGIPSGEKCFLYRNDIFSVTSPHIPRNGH